MNVWCIGCGAVATSSLCSKCWAERRRHRADKGRMRAQQWQQRQARRVDDA